MLLNLKSKNCRKYQSTLEVFSDEEWKEDINSESNFEVKVTVKTDQDIAYDTIIVSL